MMKFSIRICISLSFCLLAFAYSATAFANNPPVANAGPDQVIAPAGSNGAAVELDGTGSYDPDNDPLTFVWTENSTVISTDPIVDLTLPLGVHTITLTVNDGHGGTSSDNVVITIGTVQPPVNHPPIAIAGPDQTVEQTGPAGAFVTLNGSASYDLDGDPLTYTWRDLVSPISSNILHKVTVPVKPVIGTGVILTVTLSQGLHSITLFVEDGKGGIGSDDISVRVIDTKPPVITLNGPDTIVIMQGNTYTELNATAIDVADPSPTLAITGTVNTNVVGTYQILYTAKDISNNTSTKTRIVQVVPVPNHSPVANAGPDQVLEQTSVAGATVQLNGTASSDPDNDPLTYIWKENSNTLGTSSTLSILLPNGVHTLLLTVNDGKGGSSTDTVIIRVVDTTPPAITLIGPDTVSIVLGNVYSEQGATVTDIADPSLTLTITGIVNTNVIGTYQVVYTAKDNSNNISTKMRVILVIPVPNHSPVANAGPDQVLEQTSAAGATVQLNGTASSDPDNDPITYLWKENSNTLGTSSTLTILLPNGVHAILLTVNDGKGGSSTDTVIVRVVDTTPPTITLNGPDTVIIAQGDMYEELGATVTDAVDPSPSLTISGTVDSATAGEYHIMYTAKDNSGNTSSLIRVVKVYELTTLPIIQVLSTPTILWPANHKYTTIYIPDIVTSVTDGNGNPLPKNNVIVQSVSSDEPENSIGDGNTFNDIIISRDGRSVNLRAERDASGNGRVYTLTLMVSDASKNIGTATYEVWVPLTKTGSAINDGAKYTVTYSTSTSLLTIVVKDTPILLWPANHSFSFIRICDIVRAVYKDATRLSKYLVQVTAVSSDEEVDAPGKGDGNTKKDIIINKGGQSVYLRAERQDGGNGRVYVLTLSATDFKGNVGTTTFEVWVPVSRSNFTAVNDGPKYTVTLPLPFKKRNQQFDDADRKRFCYNFPNPFNPSTEIQFEVKTEGFVQIRVFDFLGREVATLVNEHKTAGMYTAYFDGTNLSSGTYFCRYQSPQATETIRLLLLK